MSKTAVVFSCAHATPEVDNSRFDILGKFIYDLKPDYVVDLGDGSDMKSLNSYDTRYPKQIVTQSYQADIDCYNDSQERLRWQFRHHKRKKPAWFGFEGNHECFQGHTEVFVRQEGWKNIKDVSEGDQVISLDGDWQQVRKTHKYWHEGPMYSYKTQTGEFTVTPSHRVYYYTTSNRLIVKEAKNTPWELDLPVSTQYSGNIFDHLTDEQVKFCAIALTDSYHCGNKVTFYQSGDNAKIIEQVIKDAGVEYRKYARDRSPTEICGKVLKSTQVAYEFHMTRPDWCPDQNKRIPEPFYRLSEDQADLFIDMLIFCDGSTFRDGRVSKIFYGNKIICDDVQALLQMHGRRASITEYRKGHYRVNINPRLKQRFKKEITDEIKDWVYCLTVDSGNFLARQGGVSLFTGNCRIKTALKVDPRLEGDRYGISFGHLQTDHWFDEYHEYVNNAPAIYSYDGVSYAHFFSAGNYGKPISGIHHAYTLLANRHSSSTCGHSHKISYYPKIGAYPNPIHGLVVGCFKGSNETWAGQSNGDWWKGVAVKRNLENGHYDLELVSLSQLEKMYG